MKSTLLSDVASRHDLALVDQYGTLHDGQQSYPGAVDALLRLRESNCRVVILSNSGKRAAANVARLQHLGFPPDCYDLFLSSGEIAHTFLRSGTAFSAPPRRCFLISRDDDTSILDGLDIAVVDDAGDADAIIIAGSQAPRVSLDAYAAQLAPAAARGVPALCANPDITMLTDSGFAFSAGRIAALYRELGGKVTMIGKPYPEIYREALARCPAARPVAIGDSVEHDIAGAKAAGFATAFVRTGIAEHLGEAALAAEFARYGRPDYMLDRFAW